MNKTATVNNSVSKFNVVYRVISVMLFSAVAVTIFYLSHQSGKESQSLSDSLLSVIMSFLKLHLGSDFVRTAAHFSEYVALGFFGENMLYSFTMRKKPLYALIIGTAYSVSDEIHQIFVPDRAFQIVDIAVDVAGVLVGVIICDLIFTLFEKRLKKNA